MSIKEREEMLYIREIFEIKHLLNGRYFNRSAAIAKVSRLVHLFPDECHIEDRYGLSQDIPVLYASNDELKNLLIEYRILIEQLEEK